MNDNQYDLFVDICKNNSLNEIADKLELHVGTLRRWIEKKEVPSAYYFDLCRIGNIEVDYSQFSAKEKDQFFTESETAKYCFYRLRDVVSEYDDVESYTWIEPSAGNGSFYNLLPEDKRVGIDIEPFCDEIIKSDFLMWSPSTEKNICIGNPPFGLRGNLALKFINHASYFSEYVGFILPQLFESSGKGNCKSRVKNLNLLSSEKIPSDFYYPDNTKVNVNVIFQIWSRNYGTKNVNINLDHLLKIYSLSDGGLPSNTRNKNYLYSCDFYLPSTCFGYDKMKIYTSFEDLPNRRGYGIIIRSEKEQLERIIFDINWDEVCFKSTNGALNLRFDIIKDAIWNVLPK